ncbi:hypothetical protein A2U01_0084840, partial [Trifolium medium]|nr:hypothetical protein [Trifolium medium]
MPLFNSEFTTGFSISTCLFTGASTFFGDIAETTRPLLITLLTSTILTAEGKG